MYKSIQGNRRVLPLFVVVLYAGAGICCGEVQPTAEGDGSPLAADSGDLDAGVINDATPGSDSIVPNTIALASDLFDGIELDSKWSVLRPEVVDVSVSNGELHTLPNSNSSWIDNAKGNFIYQNIEGNFRITSSMTVRRASNPAKSPQDDYNMGGIVLRTPGSAEDANNLVGVMLGTAEATFQSFLLSTSDGVTTTSGSASYDDVRSVRVCRIGDSVHLYTIEYGVIGAEWELLKTVVRPDLPNIIQAGMATMAAKGTPPDMQVNFEQIQFMAITTAADCVQ